MKLHDLSSHLIHLTTADSHEEAIQSFESIVESRLLVAGNLYIKGTFSCVCFSEAPASIIARMLGQPHLRYMPYGVLVDKAWLFARGGRPVIYQSDQEYGLLPEALRYRHARYEPANEPRGKNVDFTWEREWRIPGDVELDPRFVTLIMPNREPALYLPNNMLVTAETVKLSNDGDGAVEWQYIALADLGIEIGTR